MTQSFCRTTGMHTTAVKWCTMSLDGRSPGACCCRSNSCVLRRACCAAASALSTRVLQRTPMLCYSSSSRHPTHTVPCATAAECPTPRPSTALTPNQAGHSMHKLRPSLHESMGRHYYCEGKARFPGPVAPTVAPCQQAVMSGVRHWTHHTG